MTRYAALLRAVNVGGTGKLPMAELRAIGERCGFADVSTYIASGNLLLSSALPERQVKAAVEAALSAHGLAMTVLVRTGAELTAVLANNPFAGERGNRTVAIFLDEATPADALAAARGVAGERMAIGAREIYVFYGDGMADSRLRIPAAASGSARNINTVAKLAALAR